MNTTPPLSQEVWERTPAEAQADIRAREARVTALEATVQHLLERLRMDSRNASQPPSSDAPATSRPRQRRRSSGRKPGGQPGHPGQPRALVPGEEVAAVCPVKPTHCAHCRHPWHGEDGQPQRHQVTALPLGKPIVTEYQLPGLVCPACGAMTRAPLPSGIPPGGFGPRVQAVVALCTGAYRLSQ
jgi:transposase